jgi:hypothetical protein
MSTTQLWIAGIGTLAIFSFLYKENPIYRFFEFLLVGAGSAHLLVNTYHNYIRPTVANTILRDGNYWMIIPILFGLMMYTRYIPGLGHLSRIPMAFWLGIGSGYLLAYNPGPFIGQLTASFWKPNSFNNVLSAVLLISTLLYFIFTVGPHSRGWKAYSVVSVIGRTGIMVALGAAFGSTVMARMSNLLGRVQFLLIDWLKIAN